MPGTTSRTALKIVDGERVRIGIADVRRAAQVFRPNLICPDRLDLVENKLPARHANRDDQDERRRANHHAQRGQNEAHFVAAKSVVGKRDDLAEGHFGPKALGHESSSHVNLCYVGEVKGASAWHGNEHAASKEL